MGVSKSSGKTAKKPAGNGLAKASDAKPRAGRMKPSVAAAVQMGTIGHDVIAGRAYELYLQRGGEHGHDFEDWLAAEQELQNLAI